MVATSARNGGSSWLLSKVNICERIGGRRRFLIPTGDRIDFIFGARLIDVIQLARHLEAPKWNAVSINVTRECDSCFLCSKH